MDLLPVNPQIPGSSFQKISYIFKFMREGREYYGGVGLTHQAAPTNMYMESGRTLAGGRVRCTREFGTPCSEVNSQSILGQALSDLIMASEAKVTVANQREKSLDQILAEISTSSLERYRFNDYYVSVFTVDRTTQNRA